MRSGLLELKIEKYIPWFKGLSHTDDKKAVIVEGTLAGEKVLAEVLKETKSYILAKCVNVLEKSADRIEPICQYFGYCGGCELLYISRECERHYKAQFFSELFDSFDGVKIEEPIFLSRQSSRDRARFHINSSAKGFMARASSEVVNITSCPLLSDALNTRLSNLRCSSHPYELNCLSSLPIKIADLEYFADENVFFQSNFAIAECMLQYVCDNSIGPSVGDLYSGIGFFSKSLEARADIENIVAVEENPSCLQYAQQNLVRTHYFSTSVENFKPQWLKSKCKIGTLNTAILDPPRSGLSKKSSSNILKISPERIIYVSCNIKSNINDIKYFCSSGYKLISAKLFDMYPATCHIEAVCILEKNH